MPILEVDGDRPALTWVASIPREWKVTPGQRLVLAMLAADSYDGQSCAPGIPALAGWCGMWPSSVRDAIASLERPTDDRPALLRREDSRGGRRARIVLLRPEPTDEPGGSSYPQPTDEPGGLPTDEPTGQPTGQPTGRPTDEPGGIPTGQPTGEPGASLSLTPEPPPTARDAVDALTKTIPTARDAHALPADAARALAAGWSPPEWVDAMTGRCRPDAPPGRLVVVARELVDKTPPHVERAARDHEQATVAERLRDDLRALIGDDETQRLLTEAADVLDVPTDSLRAAKEAHTNAHREHADTA